MNTTLAFVIGVPVGVILGIFTVTSVVAIAWWRRTVRYYFGGW